MMGIIECIDVLGTTYTIKQSNKVDDLNLTNNDGYCDFTSKTIVIDTFQETPSSVSDLEHYKKQVIRHELIHAFLYESGLDSCSWAGNEEIVDWIACQFPKINDAFRTIDCI